MAPMTSLSHLANPLISPAALQQSSATQLDGVPQELEAAVRFETARLSQASGVLLRLPQELIAQAIVLLLRFWSGPDGASMLEYDARDVAAAALYLAAKPSAHTVPPRRLLVVVEYLSTAISDDYSFNAASTAHDDPPEVLEWRLSDGQYETARDRLYHIEAQILRVLGFQTHVSLPYTLCVNYLQTLDVFNSTTVKGGGAAVAKRAFAQINTALLSPQMLFLTHQPSAIAVAAIYLAAREVEVKLPEVEWWEVFDVDREELGFLIVALQSVEGFAREHRQKWSPRRVPMTVEQLQTELQRSMTMEKGD